MMELLANEKDVDPSHKRRDSATPLFMSVQNNHLAAVRYVYENNYNT